MNCPGARHSIAFSGHMVAGGDAAVSQAWLHHHVQVGSVPPSDAKIFTEYILPCLSLLPTEAELSVQVGGRLALEWLGWWQG